MDFFQVEPLKIFYIIHANVTKEVTEGEIFVAKTTDTSHSADDVTPEAPKNERKTTKNESRLKRQKSLKREKKQELETTSVFRKTRKVARKNRISSEEKNTCPNASDVEVTEARRSNMEHAHEDEKVTSSEIKLTQSSSDLEHAAETPKRSKSLQSTAEVTSCKVSESFELSSEPSKIAALKNTSSIQTETSQTSENNEMVSGSNSNSTFLSRNTENQENRKENSLQDGKEGNKTEEIKKKCDVTSKETQSDPEKAAKDGDRDDTVSNVPSEINCPVSSFPTKTASSSDCVGKESECRKRKNSESKTEPNGLRATGSDVSSGHKETKSVETQTQTESKAVQNSNSNISTSPRRQTYASPDSTSVTSSSTPITPANTTGSSFAKKYRLPSKSRPSSVKSPQGRSRPKLSKSLKTTAEVTSCDPYRFDDSELITSEMRPKAVKRKLPEELGSPSSKHAPVEGKCEAAGKVKKVGREKGKVLRCEPPLQEHSIRSTSEADVALTGNKQVPPLKLKIPTSTLHSTATHDDVTRKAITAPPPADGTSPPRLLLRISRQRSKSSGSARGDRKWKENGNRRRTHSGVFNAADVKRKKKCDDVSSEPGKEDTSKLNDVEAVTSNERHRLDESSGQNLTKVIDKLTSNKRAPVPQKSVRPPNKPLTARERLNAIAELRSEMASRSPRSGLDLLSRTSEKLATLLVEKRRNEKNLRAVAASNTPSSVPKEPSRSSNTSSTTLVTSSPAVTSANQAATTMSVAQAPVSVSSLVTANTLAPLLQLGMYMGGRPLLGGFPHMAVYPINGLLMLNAEAQRLQTPNQTHPTPFSSPNRSKPAIVTSQSPLMTSVPPTTVQTPVTSSKSPSRIVNSQKLESQIERIKQQMTSRVAKMTSAVTVNDVKGESGEAFKPISK